MIVQVVEFTPIDGMVVDRAIKRSWSFLGIYPGTLPTDIRVAFLVDPNEVPTKSLRFTVIATGTDFTLGAKSYVGSVGSFHLFQEPGP